MQSNLEFLNPGKPWPPSNEKERLERYQVNRKLFEDEHNQVFQKALRRIHRIVGERFESGKYITILNYQRLISLKTADLMLGEPPQIVLQDVKETKKLNEYLESMNFQSLLYQAALDISRYGDAVLVPYKRKDDTARLGITSPAYWFPVVSPENLKDIIAHVIASPLGDGSLQITLDEPGKQTIWTQATSSGGKILGKIIGAKSSRKTGLQSFGIMPLQGLVTSDSVHGHDDYSGSVNSIVTNMMVRISQIDRILDKHAFPSMRGPEKSLSYNAEDDVYEAKPGNYFAYENGDPMPDYMIWNAQRAAFKDWSFCAKSFMCCLNWVVPCW